MVKRDANYRKSHKFDFIALILCLVIAFGIWLYVANTNRTVSEKTIIVTVNAAEQIKNDTGMSIIGGNDQIDYSQIKVELTVTGTESALAKYKDSDYVVTIDTEAATSAARYSFTFKYQLPGDDVSFVSMSPSYISTPVFVDTIASREVPLSAEYGEGGLSAGTLESLTPKDLEKVKISGPESIIALVDRAVVYVNLAGYEKSTVVKSMTYGLFDRDGTPINNNNNYITVEPYEAEVNLVIKYTDKNVPIELKYTTDDSDVYKYDVSIQYEQDNSKATLALSGDSAYFTDSLIYDLGNITEKTGFTVSVEEMTASGLTVPEELTVSTDKSLKFTVVIKKVKIENEPEATTGEPGETSAPDEDTSAV